MDRLAPVQYRLLGYEGVIPGHGGSLLFVMGSFLTVMWSFWPLENDFDHIRKTFSLEEKNMVFIQNGTLTGGRKWPSKPGNCPLRPEMAHWGQEMTANMCNSRCDWAVVIAHCLAVEKTSVFCFWCILYTYSGREKAAPLVLLHLRLVVENDCSQ
jgi:hypothetical protein